MWQEINNLPYKQIIILILNLRHVHLESRALTMRRGTECVSDIFKNSTRRFESFFCRSLIFLSVFEILKIFITKRDVRKHFWGVQLISISDLYCPTAKENLSFNFEMVIARVCFSSENLYHPKGSAKALSTGPIDISFKLLWSYHIRKLMF